MAPTKAKPRDGFRICKQEDGTEIDFVACERSGSMREKVEMGLLRRVDTERFYVADTREEDQ